MSTDSSPPKEPFIPSPRTLEAADRQLVLYARDLKRIADAERSKSRELARANERLKRLDALKMDFLSFISHELRTPLNALNALDLLEPGGDSKQQAEVLEIVKNGYRRLNRFVSRGIEYFSWLAAGKVDASHPMNLAAVVQMAADAVPGLRDPAVDFEFSESGAPCLVRGDESSLVEVVRVLLENALKFSPGEKRIRVDLRPAGGTVVLAVADRGQGFAPELAQELVLPFTIADVDHHSEGTGLSLPLARVIAEAHGGWIRAESEGPGKGASFTVGLPALEDPKAAEGSEASCGRTGKQ